MNAEHVSWQGQYCNWVFEVKALHPDDPGGSLGFATRAEPNPHTVSQCHYTSLHSACEGGGAPETLQLDVQAIIKGFYSMEGTTSVSTFRYLYGWP